MSADEPRSGGWAAGPLPRGSARGRTSISAATPDHAGQRGQELTYSGERHLLLFGPNGSGKGTRLLIPNLLRLRGKSLVVIDPKGELAAVTADYRSQVSDVVILNPFGLLGMASAGFNPLASLDPDLRHLHGRRGGRR